MSALLKLALTVILWMVEHREEIKGLILGVQQLLAEVPGTQRAVAVRAAIEAAMQAEGKLEGTLEAVWPFVAPIFNGFVAQVKALPAPAK